MAILKVAKRDRCAVRSLWRHTVDKINSRYKPLDMSAMRVSRREPLIPEHALVQRKVRDDCNGIFAAWRCLEGQHEHRNECSACADDPRMDASDKRHALCEIIEMTDPEAFLGKSGSHPGIKLR
jgi:hypothetical protein